MVILYIGGVLPPLELKQHFLLEVRIMKPLNLQEKEILRLMANGLSNRDIAAELELTPTFVGNLSSAVYSKLRARNRAHCVKIALENHLVTV